MAISSSLLIDGPEEIKILDNDTRAEIKVVANDFDKLFLRPVGSTVGLDEDGKRLGDTDGVRELDENTAGDTSGDERLCDPASGVGSRAINLGPILAREGATTVGTPTAVRIDNDLATRQASVALRTTNNELARGL